MNWIQKVGWVESSCLGRGGVGTLDSVGFGHFGLTNGGNSLNMSTLGQMTLLSCISDVL